MKKNKSIIITGASGFVGKNLVTKLEENSNLDICKFLRTDNLETLEENIKKSDIIVHLASEIRPQNKILFDKNIALARNICCEIEKYKKSKPIIFLSSISSSPKAPLNSYERSKFEVENFFTQFSNKTKNPLLIYRPPGLFGKWSKPNYNSVVSTFCYNIANGLPIRVHDPRREISLVYIDDLVDQIIASIKGTFEGVSYPVIENIYKTNLQELADCIATFETGRQKLFVENVGADFLRKLYATFLSYLPKENFSYEIPQYRDDRGVFLEFIKTKNSGQISILSCPPGAIRGQHYHHTKNEKFIVVLGKARFRFRHIITNEKYEIETNSKNPRAVDTIPGWAHDITNIGNEELIVIIWANEVYDRKNPDTVACEV